MVKGAPLVGFWVFSGLPRARQPTQTEYASGNPASSRRGKAGGAVAAPAPVRRPSDYLTAGPRQAAG